MNEILTQIVRSLVDHPEDVRIQEETDPEGMIVLALSVHQEDMGRVIGKEGKIIQAIRTLLRVAAVNQGKRVRVDLLEAGRSMRTPLGEAGGAEPENQTASLPPEIASTKKRKVKQPVSGP